MKDLSDTKAAEKNTAEEKHKAFARRAAADGCVLLKNNGCLPFSENIRRIALYGNGARQTVKGGTGSGDVNVRSFVSIESGLENAGYEIVTKPLLEEYDRIQNEARAAYNENIKALSQKGVMTALGAMLGNPFQTPGVSAVEKNDCERFSADAAVYVVSRSCGEGADRKNEEGDYRLTRQEISDISLISESYPIFVLLLNVGGVIEIQPVFENPNINAVVLTGLGGISAGDAVSDILSGTVTPSGKLAATWAAKGTDYPCFEEFYNGDPWNTQYKEDIFVGYRWFDRQKIKPIFPFGFGLSYTSFDIRLMSVTKITDEVTVTVRVKNTGTVFSGKEVVQVYVRQPSVLSEKAEKILVAFRKTKLLAPSEEQELTISFQIEQLAFYDEVLQKWHLEGGRYIIAVGNSSDHLTSCAEINLDEKIFETEKHTEVFDEALSRRLDGFSTEELAVLVVGNARTSLTDFSVIGNASDSIPGAAGETADSIDAIPSVVMADGPAGLRLNPVVYRKDGLYINNPKEDPILSLVLPEEAQTVDLSGTVTEYRYCTALPSATVLAQTWDTGLLQEAGDVVGTEMEIFGIDWWLAPGMNIQRNPLCGRNFEYFSEDPLLTGKCAAAVTKGVQKHKGKGVTIKHFACNNKENGRNNNNSVLSERALREIYFKGFEICIKEAKPACVMSAYNLINGVHCANSRKLLTEILRDEWGFDGVVMTDWYATQALSSHDSPYGVSDAALCIRAGNDLIMPGSQADIDSVLQAIENNELTAEELRLCAKRVVKGIGRCGK